MKKLSVIALLLVTVLLLASCGKAVDEIKEKVSDKPAITTEQLVEKVEKAGLYYEDNTEDYASYDYVEKVITVAKLDGANVLWQFDFIEASEEKYSKGMFETNKKTFEDGSSDNSTKSSVNLANYSTFKMETKGSSFRYLCRIDNTLVYVDIDSDYKDEVVDFLEDIGYVF